MNARAPATSAKAQASTTPGKPPPLPRSRMGAVTALVTHRFATIGRFFERIHGHPLVTI